MNRFIEANILSVECCETYYIAIIHLYDIKSDQVYILLLNEC